jgi:hypothetical protein
VDSSSFVTKIISLSIKLDKDSCRLKHRALSSLVFFLTAPPKINFQNRFFLNDFNLLAYSRPISSILLIKTVFVGCYVCLIIKLISNIFIFFCGNVASTPQTLGPEKEGGERDQDRSCPQAAPRAA